MQEFVTCVMPTYNRVSAFKHLLDECVYWFTRQDYAGPSELLIVNDCSEQILVCDVPGVRVINLPFRISTLGAKYNYMLVEARGSVILPWEDDDIALPHRIRQCVENLGAFDYYNPQQSWYEASGQLHSNHTHGVCHNASAFRKCMAYAGRTGDQDMVADMWAKTNLKVSPITLTRPEQWDYIYRWGVSDYHLSGFKSPDEAYRAKRDIKPGRYVIEPVMRTDYIKAVRDKLCDTQ